MEIFGPLTMLYLMFTLPKEVGMRELPWENKLMAGLYVSLGYFSFDMGFVGGWRIVAEEESVVSNEWLLS